MKKIVWLSLLVGFFGFMLSHPSITTGADVPDGSEQPEEARANQEANFPLLIALVEDLGIIATPESNRFWFQVSQPVGPIVVESVVTGSSAELSGLLAGDVIEEIRRIPHYQRPGFVQSEKVTGGVVQLGKNIERAREFGFTRITLHVNRDGTPVDLILSIQ